MSKIRVHVLIIITFYIMNLYAQWDYPVPLKAGGEFDKINLCENNARSLVTGGDTVHIVFVRASGIPTVYYIRSTNKGNNWDSTLQLSVNNDNYLKPASIAISAGTLHVVWLGRQESKLFYTRSTDGGNSWDTALIIDDELNESKYTSVIADGSKVYVAWTDNRSGVFQIYLKYSSNGGNTWGSPVQVSNETVNCRHSCICILNSTVHVVWSLDGFEDKIRYSRTADNGISWSPVINVNDNFFMGLRRPCIAATGSVLRVVWESEVGHVIYTDYSSDNGLNWNTDLTLTNPESGSKIAYIFSGGSVLHLVWRQGSYYEPFYKCSYDGGNSWGAEFRLYNTNSVTSYEIGAACVGASGNILHVTWASIGPNSFNFFLHYRRNLTGNINGIEPVSTQQPREFMLYQNYPNPFNPQTIISFALPKEGLTTIKIFNQMGEVVSMPVNENFSAGTYRVSFDAVGLASGIYYYELRSGYYKETKKMTLIK